MSDRSTSTREWDSLHDDGGPQDLKTGSMHSPTTTTVTLLRVHIEKRMTYNGHVRGGDAQISSSSSCWFNQDVKEIPRSVMPPLHRQSSNVRREAG
jgi:hypothetical protein